MKRGELVCELKVVQFHIPGNCVGSAIMRQGKRKNACRSGGARDAPSHLGKPLAEGGLVGAHRDGDFLAVGEDGEAFWDFDGMGADF